MIGDGQGDRRRLGVPGRTLGFWVLTGLLVLLPLWVGQHYRVPIAQGDTWRTIAEFRQWTEGGMSDREVLGRHGAHPAVVLRPATFLFLSLGDGDLTVFTLFSWGIALVSLLAIAGIARRSAGRLDGGTGGDTARAIILIAAAGIFSMSQSFSWTWEFLWGNWLPGACLALALAVDGSRRLPSWGRWSLLVVASGIAMAAFGTGPFVWFVLGLGWGARRLLFSDRAAPHWLVTGGWMLGWAALTIFTLPGSDESVGVAGKLSSLGERLGIAAHYFLYLLGSIIGKGTAVPPGLQGALAGAIFLGLWLRGLHFLVRNRRDGDVVGSLLPWVQLGLFALFSSALICLGRSHNTLDTALAPRYITLTVWLPLSALALTWLTRRRRGAGAEAHPGRRWLGTAACGALALLMIASGVEGLREIQYHHHLKLSHAAALRFSRVLPDDARRVISPWMTDARGSVMVELAEFLEARDRLPIPEILSAEDIAGLKVLSPVKAARFEVHAEPDGSGLTLRGHTRQNSKITAPEVVLISVAPGTLSDDEFPPLAAGNLVAMARPDLPSDFFHRDQHRRQHPEHYYGWRTPIDPGKLESIVPGAGRGAPFTFKAWAYDYRDGRLRPLPEVIPFALPAR